VAELAALARATMRASQWLALGNVHASGPGKMRPHGHDPYKQSSRKAFRSRRVFRALRGRVSIAGFRSGELVC